MMRHLRFPGQPQQMLLITLDQLQYNSGLSTPLLEDPYVPAPHLEGLWIPQVRSFLRRIQGSLQIADLTIQPLQRQNDFFLMDTAVTCPLLSPSDIKRVNYCRLYLQLTTLSDMTNAHGNRIAPGIRPPG
jgi:hypothetical protein